MNIPYEKIFKTIALLTPLKFRKSIREIGATLSCKQGLTNNAKKVKSKLKTKKCLNVLFVCSECAKWKSQSLYDLMKTDPYFNPNICVTIPYSKDFKQKEYFDNLNFFKSKNIDVLEGYIPETNEFIQFETFNPDIIFYEQPYANQVNQAPEHCSEFSLSYYVPYFLPNQTSSLEYGYNFHLQMDKFFVLNESIKTTYSKLMKNKGKNLVVVGHPTLDYFYLNKNQNKEKIYVIYAPHHSMNDKRTNFATFLWSGKFMLEWAKAHPEINWIFKPHPFLRVTIQDYWTDDEIKNYWNEWGKIAKICETSDYLDLFEESYAMITDCGSFLTEFFMTIQPVIHLRREDSVHFNETVTKITDTYYKAYNLDELNSLLEKIIIQKNDTLKENRAKLLTLLDFCNTYASENIINEIKKEFLYD